MELFDEILYQVLSELAARESLEILVRTPEVLKIVESRCYRALDEIKAVIRDDGLTDPECFAKIEKIVCVFEELGSGCASRHDFG